LGKTYKNGTRKVQRVKEKGERRMGKIENIKVNTCKGGGR
jgi:hypothetical protein